MRKDLRKDVPEQAVTFFKKGKRQNKTNKKPQYLNVCYFTQGAEKVMCDLAMVCACWGVYMQILIRD